VSVEIRRGSARYVEREPGRATWHTYSFGASYDPARLGFGPMVCHDEHLLGPGRGFETHRHSGLEIVTYVVSGTLRHTDSTGSVTDVPAGAVAHLSAGAGLEHSEIAAEEGPCRFVQVWLRSDAAGDPSYAVVERLPFEPLPGAVLRVARLEPGVPTTLPAAPRLHAFVVTGALLRSSLAEPLSAGDAFEMTDEGAHEVTAGVPTTLLMWSFG
jgi:uncharacterized RmlC-like cupin family protein